MDLIKPPVDADHVQILGNSKLAPTYRDLGIIYSTL